ncbi:MAG: ATP-binding cassette domain-containing protein [Planctomycetes bacterium]|nr:ATP-binding cassette domain-containing protein [Planctomycetota bacterium]
MVKVEHVYKSQDGKPILTDITFEAEAEKITVFMGESRSGRNMLFRVLARQDEPDSGSVIIMGKDIYKISERDLDDLRKQMGIVFEQPALWSDLTAAGNVARLLEEHRPDLAPDEIQRRVDQKLGLVRMKERKNNKPYQLSGGEQRRVSIARGLALDPPLLLCDEVTAGLDPPLARQVCEILKDLNRELNVTCVVTTHNVDTAFAIADKLILLKAADAEAGDDWEGTKIIAQGPLQEVKKIEDEYIQRFLSRRAES